MLTRIYNANRPLFNDIAQCWLTAGAEAVYLCTYNGLVAKWPASAPGSADPDLSAPITSLGFTVGHLHIKGLQGAAFQALLGANSRTLAQIVTTEGEFEAVTNELIDNQDQLLALYDITQSTRSLVEVDEILDTLGRTARQLTKSDVAIALLHNEEKGLSVIQYPNAFSDDRLLQQFFDEVQASQASFLSNGNDTAHPLPAGLKNILICPIQINGKIGAALGVLNKANGGFSSPDLKLMKAIAHQAGAQIENRLLYAKTLEQAKLETEMHMARNVQVNLLSKRLPQITGVQLAARSLPALEVGGDFFDFIPQPDGSVLFVIGDVSGKGMPSALLMAMIRTAVRSSAHAIENPLPEQVMSQVNEDLYDDFTDVEMFATAVIGRYMPESAQLIYANAGHAPMILRPQNGQARMFEADGPALGMLPMNLSQNQTIPFGPGDLLVIGTDGFSEARNPSGDMFGYERLLQLTDELAHLPADEITTIFFDRIAHFSGGRPQDDDQTLMIIKGAT